MLAAHGKDDLVLGHLLEMSKPFVQETRHYKSLHFDLSEVQSRMLKNKPDTLVVDYTRTMMAFLLFNSQPRRIAMLGLGGGSLAKFCYRQLPRTRIDVVEINPAVIALRDAFEVPPDDERFRVHLGDGARFLLETTRRYDVVLLDAYSRRGLPRAMTTQAFYDSCRDALVHDGMLVMNLFCRNSQAHIDRIRESFGQAPLSIQEEDGTNRIVFATAGDAFGRELAFPPNLTLDAAALLKPALSRVVFAMQASRLDLELWGSSPSHSWT